MKLPIGRMAVESVLIIVSILLAFGIDAWWDERNDRIEEQEMLRGLQEEFVGNRRIFEGRMSEHALEVASMKRLVAATRAGEWSFGVAAFDETLTYLMSPVTISIGTGVLDAMLGAGRLELLSNRELRAQLAAWNGVFGEVVDDETDNSGMVYNLIIPYLARHGVPVSAAFVEWWDESWQLPTRSLANDEDGMMRLLTDPEFQTIAEARLGYKGHLDQELQAALDAIDEILAEIERSLR